MALRSGVANALWMAAGAAIFLVIVLIAMHFGAGQDRAEQVALQASKIETVDRMSVALESAVEAEKSAVLAITDEESQTFADQARAESATVERGRKELEETLRDHGEGNESALLAKFSETFADFRRVDDQVLALAVKNTNLKAFALAYGPAADALKEMSTALDALATQHAAAADVTAAALGAEVAALHLQTLVPPHIAEEDDAKMAALEAQMGVDEQRVRTRLDELRALAPSPDLETAAARWTHYLELKAQILELSHENTNVVSLTLSLHRKREVTLACRQALDGLRTAIAAEPIAGGNLRNPTLPR